MVNSFLPYIGIKVKQKQKLVIFPGNKNTSLFLGIQKKKRLPYFVRKAL